MTILIVGQATGSAERFREALRPVAEVVIVANDAQDALRMIRDRQDVRIVIADKEWPGADGPELLEGAEHRRVHFIQIAGRPTGIVWADDFVAEPVDLGELVARVKIARRLLDAQDELERVRGELQDQNDQLAELATTDGLTGLKNHRAFRASLEAAVSFANRKGMPLSLIMLDVDHFKLYNDTFGHPSGDEVLIAVARILRQSVREHDLVARYGGEEFVLLLPATDAESGLLVAERLRCDIAAGPWTNRQIRASLGVATTRPRIATPAELVRLADRALYRAKALGRDQTVHADDLDAPEDIKQGAMTLPFPGVGS